MLAEGSADYWRHRAYYLRLWLAATDDPAVIARLQAALRRAEAEEERIAGLRPYIIHRKGGTGRERSSGGLRAGGAGISAG